MVVQWQRSRPRTSAFCHFAFLVCPCQFETWCHIWGGSPESSILVFLLPGSIKRGTRQTGLTFNPNQRMIVEWGWDTWCRFGLGVFFSYIAFLQTGPCSRKCLLPKIPADWFELEQAPSFSNDLSQERRKRSQCFQSVCFWLRRKLSLRWNNFPAHAWVGGPHIQKKARSVCLTSLWNYSSLKSKLIIMMICIKIPKFKQTEPNNTLEIQLATLMKGTWWFLCLNYSIAIRVLVGSVFWGLSQINKIICLESFAEKCKSV